jgi:hypothetical protein
MTFPSACGASWNTLNVMKKKFLGLLAYVFVVFAVITGSAAPIVDKGYEEGMYPLGKDGFMLIGYYPNGTVALLIASDLPQRQFRFSEFLGSGVQTNTEVKRVTLQNIAGKTSYVFELDADRTEACFITATNVTIKMGPKTTLAAVKKLQARFADTGGAESVREAIQIKVNGL